ncbi:hypothetical protein ABZ622_40710 [Streptomyces sp. NPDC007164]|uniref:hypothetical protein n=1 Tax=Streptomyces sp. NPDC007164 TaxID=3156918 RepID=UPI0033F5CFF4
MHENEVAAHIGTPTPAAAPPKRRAFIGRFAPSALDMANPHQVEGQSIANAVLENAVGLMLCYDELWFLRREDCPADMQQLDFVHFVSDEAHLRKTAAEASAAGREVLMQHVYEDVESALLKARIVPPEPGHEFPNWFGRMAHVRQSMERASYRVDLRDPRPHEDEEAQEWLSRPSYFSFQAGLAIKQMTEWLIADSLQLGPMDLIVNSDWLRRLFPSSSYADTAASLQFETYKVEALERVLHLRSVDALTPGGAYHEYIADLRKDKRIRDLRTLFAGRSSVDGSAAALAREVEELIQEYQAEAFRQRHRPALLRGVGSMAISMTGNQLLPGLGGILGALVNADHVISDHRFKKNTRWAMFVLDTRDKRQSSQRSARGESRG